MEEPGAMQELKRKPYKRLKREEIMEAARLRTEGVSVSTLAHQFGVSERQLHRILKNQASQQPITDAALMPGTKQKHIQSVLQENHSAWIYEELQADPHVTLEHLAAGLLAYFGISVSQSTIWRHIRKGGLEEHGFPGHTKEQLED